MLQSAKDSLCGGLDIPPSKVSLPRGGSYLEELAGGGCAPGEDLLDLHHGLHPGLDASRDADACKAPGAVLDQPLGRETDAHARRPLLVS